MKTKRNIFAAVILVLICICLFWTNQTSAIEKSLEVNTYSLPETRTDTARAIDAYQQMINRLLDQNDKKSAEINLRLAKIEASLRRIEHKLGLEPNPGTDSCKKKCDKKCSEEYKKSCDKKCSTDPEQPSCGNKRK
jgi:hypothetical protein